MTFKKTIKKTVKTLVVATFVAVSVSAKAATNPNNDFDWVPVMEAITQVESGGNCKAVSGKHVGPMQISPGMVEECNQILAKRGDKRRFTLKDRYNKQKSQEMFVVFQSKYNSQNNVERAIRMWNGGPGFTVNGTQRYLQRVMKHLNK